MPPKKVEECKSYVVNNGLSVRGSYAPRKRKTSSKRSTKKSKSRSPRKSTSKNLDLYHVEVQYKEGSKMEKVHKKIDKLIIDNAPDAEVEKTLNKMKKILDKKGGETRLATDKKYNLPAIKLHGDLICMYLYTSPEEGAIKKWLDKGGDYTLKKIEKANRKKEKYN